MVDKYDIPDPVHMDGGGIRDGSANRKSRAHSIALSSSMFSSFLKSEGIQFYTFSNGYFTDPGGLRLQYNTFDPENLSYNYGSFLVLEGKADRYLPRLEAPYGTATYALWMSICDGDLSFKGAQLSGHDNDGFEVKAEDTFSFKLKDFGDNHPDDVLDFTSASLNGITHLFWINSGDNNIYSSQIRLENIIGEGPSNAPPIVSETKSVYAFPKDAEILSIDVTMTYLQDKDTPAITQNAFTLALLYRSENKLYLDFEIFDPETGKKLQSYSYEQPFIANSDINNRVTQDSSVRVIWGTMKKENGQQQANGITVAITAHQDETDRIRDSTSHTGNVFMSCLTLDNNNNGDLSDWSEDITPDNSFAYHSLDDTDADFTFSSMSGFSLHAVTKQTDSTCWEYNITAIDSLFAFRSKAIVDSIVRATTLYTRLIPSMQMEQIKGKPQKPFKKDNEHWSLDDAEAAISSWQLIGIVTGVPPIPLAHADLKDDWNSSVQISFKTSSGHSITSDTENSLKVGGQLFGSASSISWQANNDISKGEAIQLETIDNFDLSAIDPDLSMGWLLFFRPTYTLYSYKVKPLDRSGALDEPIIFQRLSQSLADQANEQSIFPVPFNLEHPQTPVASEDIFQKAIVEGWDMTNLASTYHAENWDDMLVQPIVNSSTEIEVADGEKVGLPALNVVSNIAKSNFTDLNNRSFSSSSKMTIAASNECEIMKGVLGFEVGGTLSMAVTNKFDVQDAFNIDLSWGVEKNLGTTLTITPYLGTPKTSSEVPWLPKHFKGQSPWILTWVYSSETSNN